MDEQARKLLIIGAATFFGVFVLIFVISLLFRTPSISASEPFIGPTISNYSPINNGSIRFFNGRNFIEYNLVDGTTKQLLSDGIYPSTKIVDWSNDGSKVLVYTQFYLNNDVFISRRTQADRKEPANLWVIDLNTRTFTKLPTGFNKGNFSADSKSVYITETTDLPGFLHGEEHEMLVFSLETNKPVTLVRIPAYIASTISFETDKYVLIANSSAIEQNLFSLSSAGINIESPAIAGFQEIATSPNGFIVTREVIQEQANHDHGGTEISGTEFPQNTTLEIYDANLNSLKEINKIDGDVSIFASANHVFAQYAEGDNNVIYSYNLLTREDNKSKLGDINDEEAALIPSRFITDGTTTLIDTAEGLRILGDDQPPKPLNDEAFETVKTKLLETRGFQVTEDRSSLSFTLYGPLRSTLPTINQVIESNGLDPNIIDMAFTEDF